jgi:hypothetical protein
LVVLLHLLHCLQVVLLLAEMLQHPRHCLLSVVAVETIFWLPSEAVPVSRRSLIKRKWTAALQQCQAVNLLRRVVRVAMAVAAMLLVVVSPVLWQVHLLPESLKSAIVVSFACNMLVTIIC